MWSTLVVFQLENTVRLFGTLLLLDPIHFPKAVPYNLISVSNWSTFRYKFVWIDLHLLYTLVPFIWNNTLSKWWPVPYIPHTSFNWNSRVACLFHSRVRVIGRLWSGSAGHSDEQHCPASPSWNGYHHGLRRHSHVRPQAFAPPGPGGKVQQVCGH